MLSKQWLQSEAFLYRLSDDPRPSNTDLVQVTMADGTTDLIRRAVVLGRSRSRKLFRSPHQR